MDVQINWQPTADITLGFNCPLPIQRTFMSPVPPKNRNRAILYVASRCDERRDGYVRKLMELTEVVCAGQCLNNERIPGEDSDRRVEAKLALMHNFYFYLAFESSSEPHYVTEKVYHAFAAGVVPIYLGTDNIDEYVPAGSIIKTSDYASTEALVAYLHRLMENESEYMRYFAWKEDSDAVAKLIKQQENCVHNAHIRICNYALEHQRKLREQYESDKRESQRTTRRNMQKRKKEQNQ